MALALTAVIVVTVFASLALLLWHTQRGALDRVVGAHLRTRYVVTLKSGETFDGLLDDADGSTLVLIAAKSLAAGRDPLPVDGALLLARSDVAYLQRP